MIQQTKYVSIPKGIPTQLVKSNKELKAVTVWYQLKSLLVGGYIRNFGHHAKDIAATFGYSESKLRKYVAVLTQQGYIERPNRHDLVLRSTTLLRLNHNSAKARYKIASNKLSHLELEIRALALQENLERQQYTLTKKLQERHLAGKGNICSIHLMPAARKRRLRGFSARQEQVTLQSHLVRDIAALKSEGPETGLNPFVTLSRQGIARVLSRKSKATGYRYARKLAAAGLLADEKNHVFICDASLREYGAMREEGFDHTYRFVNNTVVKVLCNNITPLPSLWQGLSKRKFHK